LRRTRRALGVLLAVGGLLAVGDAVLTTVWQEPLGALRASAAQDELGQRYSALLTDYSGSQSPAREPVRGVPVGSLRAKRLRRAHSAGRLNATTRSGDPLGRLRIPRMGLSAVWVQSTNAAALSKAPGHYSGTVLPGRRGTVGIAGHRTTHGAPFRQLNRLRAGDRIDLSMPYGAYRYAVERTRIVSPEQAEVLRAAGSDRLVLTACHPLWSAKQRIVVTARLVRWPDMSRRSTPRPAAAPVAGGLFDARTAVEVPPALGASPPPAF